MPVVAVGWGEGDPAPSSSLLTAPSPPVLPPRCPPQPRDRSPWPLAASLSPHCPSSRLPAIRAPRGPTARGPVGGRMRTFGVSSAWGLQEGRGHVGVIFWGRCTPLGHPSPHQHWPPRQGWFRGHRPAPCAHVPCPQSPFQGAGPLRNSAPGKEQHQPRAANTHSPMLSPCCLQPPEPKFISPRQEMRLELQPQTQHGRKTKVETLQTPLVGRRGSPHRGAAKCSLCEPGHGHGLSWMLQEEMGTVPVSLASPRGSSETPEPTAPP